MFLSQNKNYTYHKATMVQVSNVLKLLTNIFVFTTHIINKNDFHKLSTLPKRSYQLQRYFSRLQVHSSKNQAFPHQQFIYDMYTSWKRFFKNFKSSVLRISNYRTYCEHKWGTSLSKLQWGSNIISVNFSYSRHSLRETRWCL